MNSFAVIESITFNSGLTNTLTGILICDAGRDGRERAVVVAAGWIFFVLPHANRKTIKHKNADALSQLKINGSIVFDTSDENTES